MKTFNVDRTFKDEEIIRLAIINTCKNKHRKNGKETSKYRTAKHIMANLEDYVQKMILIIKDSESVMKLELKNLDADMREFRSCYIPSKQTQFTIRDGNSGKIRQISSIPIFPDQIIHQLIVMCGQEGMQRGMYHHSYGSLPKRGVYAGKKYIENYIKNSLHNSPTEIKYTAQLDITKCYPNISHEHLKALLRKRFRGHLFYGFAIE